MPFDAHKNLAIATVATAPSPATSGTTLVVSAGEGARFPAAPFNATVWPATDLPTPATAEVVRVTARSTDTLTITRAQESTTARAIVPGDLIAATITAKTITDIESGANFPLITTPGAVTVGTDVGFTGPGTHTIKHASSDAGILNLAGANAVTSGSGSYVSLTGNSAAGEAGRLALVAGNGVIGQIQFYTGASALRGVVHPSGGFSWGGMVDPGVGAFLVGSGVTLGQVMSLITPGLISIGTAGSAAAFVMVFQNAGGTAGYIQTSGLTTVYATTSDQRLKEDRGAAARAVAAGVLRETIVHDFTWTADGTPGRGVFAQEAAAVAPFAVTVGADDVDDQGRLTKPWGVDYSKYVPDLVVGWQAHEAQVVTLEAKVATLEARLAALEAALAARG